MFQRLLFLLSLVALAPSGTITGEKIADPAPIQIPNYSLRSVFSAEYRLGQDRFKFIKPRYQELLTDDGARRLRGDSTYLYLPLEPVDSLLDQANIRYNLLDHNDSLTIYFAPRTHQYLVARTRVLGKGRREQGLIKASRMAEVAGTYRDPDEADFMIQLTTTQPTESTAAKAGNTVGIMTEYDRRGAQLTKTIMNLHDGVLTTQSRQVKSFQLWRAGRNLLLESSNRIRFLRPAAGPGIILPNLGAKEIPDGYRYVHPADQTGLVNPAGKTIADANHRLMTSLPNGDFLLRKNRSTLLRMNAEGKVIWSVANAVINPQPPSYLAVLTFGGEGLLDNDGNWVIPPNNPHVAIAPETGLRIFGAPGNYQLLLSNGRKLPLPTSTTDGYLLNNGTVAGRDKHGNTHIYNEHGQVVHTLQKSPERLLVIGYDRYLTPLTDSTYALLLPSGEELTRFNATALGETDGQRLSFYQGAKVGLLNLQTGTIDVTPGPEKIEVLGALPNALGKKLLSSVLPAWRYTVAGRGRFDGAFEPLD
ncbi:macro domain-containing protein [Neolewinella agarilytica]|uniref:Uncharacterized protein n=1 Tax=Neolewinella agarilytica TaxID=478744 RepID=A0A1H9HFW6_9BACT|nr:hypothetical protein [Neolewinella agarilytica]SEQ61215.1 hypothetical protein SAMN05444359_112145 [Neolewinella agarilytica]